MEYSTYNNLLYTQLNCLIKFTSWQFLTILYEWIRYQSYIHVGGKTSTRWYCHVTCLLNVAIIVVQLNWTHMKWLMNEMSGKSDILHQSTKDTAFWTWIDSQWKQRVILNIYFFFDTVVYQYEKMDLLLRQTISLMLSWNFIFRKCFFLHFRQ